MHAHSNDMHCPTGKTEPASLLHTCELLRGLIIVAYHVQEHVLPTLAGIVSQSGTDNTTLVEAALTVTDSLLKLSKPQQAERMHARLSGHVMALMMQRDDPAILGACCMYMRSDTLAPQCRMHAACLRSS
jgi:hypothetical protein